APVSCSLGRPHPEAISQAPPPIKCVLHLHGPIKRVHAVSGIVPRNSAFRSPYSSRASTIANWLIAPGFATALPVLCAVNTRQTSLPQTRHTAHWRSNFTSTKNLAHLDSDFSFKS